MDKLAARTLLVGIPGPDLDRETARRLRDTGPAGVILFGRNLDAPERLATLVAELERTLPAPAIVAIDQEGGRVSRLERWLGPTPPAASLAARGPSAAFRFGKLTGDALLALGFNLDFAPVVDLCSPSDDANAIGDRAWSHDADTASREAGAFLEGLLEARVAGCLKHFPGLGATCVDSHRELPTDARPDFEIVGRDLVPFRVLGARAPAVMVGHAHYPAWEPEGAVPASGSRRLVSGLLRSTLGFGGLVVTDDLEMGAVRALDDGGEFAVQSMRAGCDLLLYCADPARAETAIARMAAEARRDRDFEARLRSAVEAVERLARRWPAHTPDLVAWSRAREAVQAFAAD